MSNIMNAASRIREVYKDHVQGEESFQLSEEAARWLQDVGLLKGDEA